MIIDVENLFSDDQAITSTPLDSSNVIDLGADHAKTPSPNLKDIKFLCQVTTAFSGGTGTGLSVVLETDDNTSFSSSTVLYTSPVIGTSALVAGYQFNLPGLPINGEVERYLQLVFTSATGAYAAGNITAGIVLDIQSNT